MRPIDQPPSTLSASGEEGTERQGIDSALLPRGYEWPASRLSSQDMKRLAQMRHETKIPITRLLQNAVTLLWDTTRKERAAEATRLFREKIVAIVDQLAEEHDADEAAILLPAGELLEPEDDIAIQVTESIT